MPKSSWCASSNFLQSIGIGSEYVTTPLAQKSTTIKYMTIFAPVKRKDVNETVEEVAMAGKNSGGTCLFYERRNALLEAHIMTCEYCTCT